MNGLAGPVSTEQVAHFCAGTELYGVGSVQRLYAEGAPGLLFVCFGTGPMYDWLQERGHRSILFPGVQTFVVRSSVGAALRMPELFLRLVRDAQGLDKLLKRESIRVVHAHWLAQQVTAGLLRPKGYTAVWHLHNNMNPNRLKGLGPLINNALARRWADLMIPVSEFIANNWLRSGVPLRIVRNAAVSLGTGPSPMPEGPIRCLTAGRLDESKGHHIAVEAVIAARQLGLDVRLDIFGGPVENNDYADSLRRRIGSCGHARAFQFMGFRTNLRDRHAEYTLGLQCRVDPEPCSVWVCETLVDGLPLIASANGGTPELVKDGETGLLFEPGNSADLAQKLMDLAMDRERLAAMRQAAFERGSSQFVSERFISQTFEAYGDILKTAE